MALLLRNLHAIDPTTDVDATLDIRIENGVITQTSESLAPLEEDEVVDLSGRRVVPGLVDLHVHLREPGQEYKETIRSGCRAAARGGFTDIAPMPNTRPACDDGASIEFVKARAAETGCVHVRPVGAITRDLAGTALSEMGDMVRAGACAFSDDGRGVQDDGVMRRALDYAKQFDVAVLSHCQRESLSGKGVVNEGLASTRLGMAGWPAAAEEIQIARDVRLSELTGCAVHIQHVTTRRGVDIVAEARDRGIRVSSEVTPHHLFLSEDDIDEDYDTNLKMNPPLRSREDMLALQEALVDDLVDIIATDHAPHAPHEKAVEFELAPFGTTGLETALSLMLTHLVLPGKMTWAQLVTRMSVRPREIAHLPRVSIAPGSPADLTIIDETAIWTVGEEPFESKAVNSAFTGQRLTGRATDLIVDGVFVMRDGRIA